MTSPVLMPVGHEIVAADLVAYQNLTGAWTSYSPAWTTSGTQPVIGNGSIVATYIQVGKLIICSGTIVAGSTTTFGTGGWSIGLPVANNSNNTSCGVVTCYSGATSTSRPAALRTSGGTFSAYSTTGVVDATDPFTWGSTSEFHWLMAYQAA